MLASPTVAVVEQQPVTGRLLLLRDKNENERAKDALRNGKKIQQSSAKNVVIISYLPAK